MNARATKRRRKKASFFPSSHSTANEERFLQKHTLDYNTDAAFLSKIPRCPVFYPTIEDMEGSPLDYIEKIRPIAERYGICKIVPPTEWNPGFGVDFDSSKRFDTVRQFIHRLQEGISFGNGDSFTAEEYQAVASVRSKDWKQRNYPHHDLLKRHLGDDASDKDKQKLFTPESLERDYWNIVENRDKENACVAVEYGNDVDTAVFGSGFPLSERGRSVSGTCNELKMSQPEPDFGTQDYYKETWWNLNNIASAPNCVLKHVKVGITGINVPWMYFGSIFSTFAWHNEDNYLYSVNYHHKGAPKQWYGIPGNTKAASGVEDVFKRYLSMKMKLIPDLMHHITTMFSPRLFQHDGIPICKTLQYEGEYVVTFPRAFHSGFSLGPNIGEAVNFSPHDWVSYGGLANERYRSFNRPAVFSHDRLAFTMAHHLSDQRDYKSCQLLKNELKRIVDEELRRRDYLKAAGVRDVSDLIMLPPNVVDRIDEDSADYDDRRLCHTCKHVCFFAAVACECSQLKVSCLRHCELLCTCEPSKKYFMFWTKDEDLRAALESVEMHCEMLKGPADEKEMEAARILSHVPLPPVAEGVEKDMLIHKGEDVSVAAVTRESFAKRPRCGDAEVRKAADEHFAG
ncbi:hypothetical protein MPSEU_000013000 [Mayamaea pseudoterrestris]|nr:hypothetical protein MPSEU_000013000 [Mayamaea pseudoterrestris]